jgi:hypothetical protein
MNRRDFVVAVGGLCSVPGITTLCPRPAAAQPVSSAQAAGRTLLLVDDQDVLYRPGTVRVLHPLKRHPRNPILAGRVKPWEVAIGYTSVYRDPENGRFQLWYQSYAGPNTKQKPLLCTVCCAESSDGLEWVRPNYGVHPFEDVRETNIVLLSNGGTSLRYGASVVVDALTTDSDRRYKMAYFDFAPAGGRDVPGLNVAFSPDGIHWTKYPHAPLLPSAYGDGGELVPFHGEPGRELLVPLALSDVIDACYDSRAHVFAIYCKVWVDGPEGRMFWKRGVGRTQSQDFVHWSPPELVMAPDELDGPTVELHSAPAFFHQDCYFGLVQLFDPGNQGQMDIELALSRDGLHWQRPFRRPFFLPVNTGDQFDSGMLVSNATPVFLEDEFRFYFGAYNRGLNSGDDSKMTTGVGLYTMPRDRFAGLRPVENFGQVTLRALDLGEGRRLTLNGDASSGSIRVEVLDADGHRVRGFTGDDAVPLRGDSLRHPVRWRNQAVKQLPPGRYLLRVHLENAELFALSIA